MMRTKTTTCREINNLNKNQDIIIDEKFRKRTTLSECIDEIYMTSGMNLPIIKPSLSGRKDEIARNINLLLYSTNMERNKVARVKRQLFPITRMEPRHRKPIKSKVCKKSTLTLTLDYRSIRGLLRKKRVRKNVLLMNVEEEQQKCQIKSPDKLNGNELKCADCSVEEKNVNIEELWTQQQYNMELELQDKIMEETLRTVYYLKSLTSAMCY